MMHSMALMSDRATRRSLVPKTELWRTKSTPESSSKHTDRDRRVSPMRSELAPRSKINARAQNPSSVSGSDGQHGTDARDSKPPGSQRVLLMNDLVTHRDTDAPSDLRSTFVHRVKSASPSAFAAWQSPLLKHCKAVRARGHARKSGEPTAAHAVTWRQEACACRGSGPKRLGPLVPRRQAISTKPQIEIPMLASVMTMPIGTAPCATASLPSRFSTVGAKQK